MCQITTLLQTRAEKDPRDRAEQWQPQTQNTVNAKLEAIRDSFTSFSSISEVNTVDKDSLFGLLCKDKQILFLI